jgi:hypothetical protein
MSQGRATCGDCGAREGDIHNDGCDVERCAFCDGQLISCDCALRHFYPEMRSLTAIWLENEARRAAGDEPIADPTWVRMGIPEDVYRNGLLPSQEAEWQRIATEKGFVPFIEYPLMCGRCGTLWPDFFMVPDEEWQHYIEIGMRDEIICRPCYDFIKTVIGDGALAQEPETRDP